MTELSTEPAFKLRRRQMAARAVMALCGALAVLAGIYGIGRLRSNPADAACQPAVNIDTRDPEKPLKFLKDVGITHLAYYSDDSAHVYEDLKAAGKAFGMPTTVLVDRSGCEIGNMAGPAEWSSADGVKLVSAAATGS